MADWSLPILLKSLHDDIHLQLEIARKAFSHPGSKGEASETIWLELFELYLPKRYQVCSGFVVDSDGKFSEQIDVIIFDRQYSPFIFNFKGQKIVPAESVYAVFEAKQTLTAEYIRYASNKIASVNSLMRTSLPIPHAGGTFPPKAPHHIIGGILTFECEWKPPFGVSLKSALKQSTNITMGCVAAHGHFFQEKIGANSYQFILEAKPATAFLFRLISELQFRGTVPMIDILAYSKWLNQSP